MSEYVPSLIQCDRALEYLRNAKAQFPLMAKFEEGEVDFAYQTARNAIILAEAHIRECRDQWAAQEKPG